MVKTLVFIHGWASTPDVWQGQRDYFAGNYEVILPDISRAEDIKEAGGIVTDFGGGPDYMLTGNIVSGNPALHGEILKEVKGVFRGKIDK